MSEKLIAGFLKVRNEVMRGGNIYRVLNNMSQYCDEIFVCDDASYDGTYEYLKEQLPEDHILRVQPEQQSFRDELKWKQELLKLVHRKGPWEFIFWMDGDEVLDRRGTVELRDFCKQQLMSSAHLQAWSMHYTQLWRNASYARTDSGFDDGWFIKLWRYTPELMFDVINGTHHAQFPTQIHGALQSGKVGKAPYEVIHYGNYGVNLRWKAIQYYGGLGGVDRHIQLKDAKYRSVASDLLPEGIDAITGSEPSPFSDEQLKRIYELKNLQELKETFCIIIPSHNRGYALGRALDSVLAQTYDKWICFVLDDGSSDDTEQVVNEYVEKDPRIFYAKYLERRGGVAMNEVGCDIAVNTAQYWVRLGSDDWLMPKKLELDKLAFDEGHRAIYGPFTDHHNGKFMNIGNLPIPPAKAKEFLAMPGGFAASWANVAVDCRVLKDVKKIWGCYCDPRLQNMEDAELNYKISKLVNWVFRGQVKTEPASPPSIAINPEEELIKKVHSKQIGLIPDGVWNINTLDGSSANSPVYARDRALTDQLIAKHEQEMLWLKA